MTNYITKEAVRRNLPYILDEYAVPSLVAELTDYMFSQEHLNRLEYNLIVETFNTKEKLWKLVNCLMEKDDFGPIFTDIQMKLDDNAHGENLQQRLRNTVYELEHPDERPMKYESAAPLTNPPSVNSKILSLANALDVIVTHMDETDESHSSPRSPSKCGRQKFAHGDSLTTLMEACSKGDIDKVRDTLNNLPHGNVNSANHDGQTSLMLACQSGNSDIISLFLNCGNIDVNKQDRDGCTAIMYACRTGNMECLWNLLKNTDVDLSLSDNEGITTIWYLFLRQFISLLSLRRGISACFKRSRLIVRNITQRIREIQSEIKLHCMEIVEFCADKGASHAELLQAAFLFGDTDIVSVMLHRIPADELTCVFLKLIVSAVMGSDDVAVLMFLDRTQDLLMTLTSYQISILVSLCVFMDNGRITQQVLNHIGQARIDSILISLIDIQKHSHEHSLCSRFLRDHNLVEKDCDGNTLFMLICEYSGYDVVSQVMQLDDIDCLATNSKGQTALMLSCFNHHRDVPKLLSSSERFSWTAQDTTGQCAFMYACNAELTNVLFGIKDDTLDVNMCDSNGVNSLLNACMNGGTEVVEFLLSKEHCNVHVTDGCKRSCLMHACLEGHTKIVAMLLEHGVDVNAENSDGVTALMYASGCGYCDLVSLLLKDKNILVNLKDRDGFTALMYACMNKHVDVAVLLLGHPDTEVNLCDDFGTTVLILACNTNPNISLIRALLECEDIDINARDKNGFSAFSYACKNGFAQAVSLLLQVPDVDVNSRDSYIKSLGTPLMWACQNGHVSVVSLLLRNEKVAINAQKIRCITAFMLACLNNHVEVVALLLEHGGVEVNAQSKSRLSGFMYACLRGHTDVVKLLLCHSCIDVNAVDKENTNAFMWTCVNGHRDVIEQLLDSGIVDTKATCMYGTTPFMLACCNGHKEVASLLLEREGIDVNAVDNFGHTALMSSCFNGMTDVVSFLLEQHDIDVNLANQNGATAFTEACGQGHSDIVSLLLKCSNINVNSVDDTGRTGFMLACRNGHEDIVKLLLETDAINVNIRDNNGKTAHSLALERGHGDIAAMLVKHSQLIHTTNA